MSVNRCIPVLSVTNVVARYRDARVYTGEFVYTFTKFNDSVHKHGGKTKFGVKSEESIKVVNSKTWYFCVAANLSDNRMKELY